MKVGDKSMEQYMKEIAYKDEIVRGWTLDELRNRFSNKLWDDINYSCRLGLCGARYVPRNRDSCALEVMFKGHGVQVCIRCDIAVHHLDGGDRKG